MIIDFHTHIFPDKIAAGTIKNLESKAGLTASTDGTVKGTVVHRVHGFDPAGDLREIDIDVIHDVPPCGLKYSFVHYIINIA